MKEATLCFCIRRDEVLLGLKKVRFGAGKWNGFSGKVDPGETPREAAARELFEESGLATDADALEHVGDLRFFFGETPIFRCYVYLARSWENDPEESDEMRPQWFPIRGIPLKEMWDSDRVWVPRVLAGEKLAGTFVFDDAGKTVVASDVHPL